MATKKTLEEDVTKNPQATTEGDVNGQDTATRLWQSLKNTYGNQMEESDKAYDKAISQQNNAMLARGMQRSSYGASISAGLLNQKNQARNRLGESLIASYQDRLSQLEEAEAARKFQAEEAEKGRVWQSGENALSRAHETSEREAGQKWQSGENLLDRENQIRLQTEQNKWQSGENLLDRENQIRLQTEQNKWQSGENALTREHETAEREGKQAWQSSENLLDRAHETAERIAGQEWQSGENEKTRQHTTAERIAGQEFTAGENEKNRQHDTAERLAGQEFTAGENEKNRALTQQQIDETHLQNTISNQQWEQSFNAQQTQNAIQNAFNERQLQMQQDQWREQFDYNEKSNLQKISMEKVMAIIQNGNDPDDTLLGQAGMTRAEANGMKAQVQSSGGGTNNPGGNTPDWQTAGYDSAEDMAEAQANGYTNANDWKAYKLLNENKGIWSGLPGTVQSGSTTSSTSGDTTNRLKHITRRT